MEALYRKYRPSTFADVVGQEHIERTLKNAIEQGKVSHAYLFCGPRGTGKTTTARILAKALLCKNGPTTEPDGTCEECQAIAQGAHPDVYELDAASRTGVENVREEIISRVSYAPTRGKWKVYIIDEVHMLSTAAFNALLKTIEEPPDHVAFILCTTDPQKVPETIQSRCQRFDFHRISIESIVSRLGSVCVGEGVEFEPEALELIAHRAEGGMRNALTTLEQLIAFDAGKVTLAGAQNLLGTLDDTDLSEIVEAIGKRDAVACFNWLGNYVETGADLAQFVQDLAEYVRTMYLLSLAGLDVELQVSNATRKAMEGQLPLFGEDRLARMLAVLGDVSRELRTASNPRLVFEIALTRLVRPESDLTLQALAERVEELERKLAGLAAAPAVQQGLPVGSVAPAPSVPAPSAASANGQSASAPVPSVAPGVQPAPLLEQSQGASRAFAPATTPASADRRAAADPSMAPRLAQNGHVPAPAPASSTPQPAQQPAAPAVSAPVPAPAPLDAAASVPAQGAAAMTASIEVSNPAALQRFWRSVTSTLRKVNPARGVLFMNAKVFAEPNGKGIVVQFGKDGGFAYNAAQKTEVQELLAKTIAQVAGGMVPYRLSIEGGAPSAVPAVSVPAPAQAASSRPEAPVSPARPLAPARSAQPVAPSAIDAAPREQEPRWRPPAAADAPIPGGAASRPGDSQTAPASADQRPALDYDPVPYDEVPLDVYGASVPEELDDEGYDTASPRSAASAPVASPKGAPSIAQSLAEPATRAGRAPSAAPAEPASEGMSGASPTGGSEVDQIKSILTNSFGPGVKFEELPE